MKSNRESYPHPVKSLKLADYEALVKMAYLEDHIKSDLSTFAIFTQKEGASAEIIAKETGIISGLPVIQYCFKYVDRLLKTSTALKDGASVQAGQSVFKIRGNIQSILTAERVALNFLGMLSGISTRANHIQKKLMPFKVTLLDTRKTVPGYRVLSKYAVTMGGARNHRQHLADMGMIKENHIAQAGGITQAVTLFRKKYGRKRLEVEVASPRQLKEALSMKPDIILLDNMTSGQLKKCSEQIRAFNRANKTQICSEASGGFNEKNLAKLKGTGVDYVSMGSLTHTIKPLDFSLLVTK